MTIQPFAPGRANLIARLPGAGQGGHLVVCGHMDIAPPGVNAVAAMAPVITALQANPFSFAPHPLLGESTVSVATISGGEKINSY